jgi:hypothetical protein
MVENAAFRNNKLLQTTPIGQSVLNPFDCGAGLRPLAQSSKAHHKPTFLSPEPTADKIAHLLRNAGVKCPLFTLMVLRVASRHSSGELRLIKRICRRALVASFDAQRERV